MCKEKDLWQGYFRLNVISDKHIDSHRIDYFLQSKGIFYQNIFFNDFLNRTEQWYWSEIISSKKCKFFISGITFEILYLQENIPERIVISLGVLVEMGSIKVVEWNVVRVGTIIEGIKPFEKSIV